MKFKGHEYDCRICDVLDEQECILCKKFWKKFGQRIKILCALTTLWFGYGLITWMLGVGTWNWR